MLKKMPSFSLFAFILVAACFVTAQITYNETDKQWKNEIERLISSSSGELQENLSEVMETVNSNSMYSCDTKTLTDGISEGYVEALSDRFAMYLSDDEYKEYLSFVSNSSNKGIGVSTIYDSENEGIRIISVYKGSPAEQSGIVPGDVITGVEGKKVFGMSYYSVMNILGGDYESDRITLEIMRHDGSRNEIEIVKSDVSLENITGKSVTYTGEGGDKTKMGVITISRFASGAEDEVKKFEDTLGLLVMEGCERFVIDLRNNPGGSIETVSQLLDCFLRDGPVFTVSYNSGVENTVIANTGKSKLPYPYMFALLVNENTVCEAEIFAKALSNASVAQLFGTNTYGKATVQSLYELSNGGAVSLSYAKYTPAASEDFDGVGITPENVVELPLEAKMSFTTLKDEDDTQLREAMKYLFSLEKKEFYD